MEYAWGKLKYTQRSQNEESLTKLEGGKVFISKIKALCVDRSVLPMDRVWKYQRRARDYIRLYDTDAARRDGEGALTYKEIEFMRKNFRTHRNIMEIERNFILND